MQILGFWTILICRANLIIRDNCYGKKKENCFDAKTILKTVRFAKCRHLMKHIYFSYRNSRKRNMREMRQLQYVSKLEINTWF